MGAWTIWVAGFGAVILAASGAPPRTEVEPAPADSPPHLPPRAAGHGWFCIKSATYENMSSCFRTAEQCARGRQIVLDGGQKYGPCLAQARAACFTYRNVLQGLETFDCSATNEACDRQRAYALAHPKDVANVSDCGAVD